MSKPYYETEEYNEAENELDTYDDPVKLVMEYRISEKHKDNKIANLEAKLAKSEKERELDNSFWKQECDSLQKTLVEKDKEIENLTEELDDKNFCKDFVDLYTENKLKTQMLNENWKDKISFTIQQLEKVKETLMQNADEIGEEYKEDYFMISLGNIKNIIDNQIKQLKEMK